MSNIKFSDALGEKLIKLLGLPKSTKSLSLSFYAGEPAVVSCEYWLVDGERVFIERIDSELDNLDEAIHASSDVV